MSGDREATRLNQHESVAVLTLNRPERRNLLDRTMVDEIVATFDELERAGEVSAVVLTGEGSAFCAGADLGSLQNGPIEDFVMVYEGFLRIARSSLPTVAAVNGPAVGAGMNLALCCDVRFVGPSARFISRFPTLGLHPGGGHAWMIIQESGRELAAAMLLFGQELRGDQIVDAGLAFQYVPNADDLVSEAVTFAEGAARVPRALATRLKHTLDGHRAIESHPAAVEFELEAQAWSREQDFFTEQISEAIGRQKKGGDRGS